MSVMLYLEGIVLPLDISVEHIFFLILAVSKAVEYRFSLYRHIAFLQSSHRITIMFYVFNFRKGVEVSMWDLEKRTRIWSAKNVRCSFIPPCIYVLSCSLSFLVGV